MIRCANRVKFGFHLSLTVVRSFTMASADRNLLAVCQMTSTNNKDDNFATCADLVKSAKSHKVKMVFLPEACDYIGEGTQEIKDLAEPLSGSLMTKYRQLAKENGVWLSLGGIHEKTPEDGLSNSHVVIDDEGEIRAVYRKIHLFDVDIPERGVSLKESAMVTKGKEIVAPIDTPIGKVGLGICYDLRFPEFSMTLTNMGAEVLTFPSAFTFTTGAAHWEILLRARAVETQCFVIAAAQTGSHNKKRSSWGHAMIVDPWGTIVAQCSEGTNLSVVNLNLSRLFDVRASMPVRNHRRHDLYPKLLPNWRVIQPDQETYTFGQTTVKAGQVFLQSEYSFAFTNKKCVLPGHVLVSPVRCVKSLSKLRPEETKDLFLCVQKVQKAVENKYGANSSTITIQDGRDAGQTIEHVHVHILPRRPGDFSENDDIYRAIEKNGSNIRSEEEMIEEAIALRRYFYE